MWTRRPIVKVAMGCRTEPAAVHIAHVLQRLDFFQFFNFFYNLHDLQQKKNYTTYSKKKNSIFFYNSHDLQQKKKITRIYSIKKKSHDYTVFLYTTYIFHNANTRREMVELEGVCVCVCEDASGPARTVLHWDH